MAVVLSSITACGGRQDSPSSRATTARAELDHATPSPSRSREVDILTGGISYPFLHGAPGRASLIGGRVPKNDVGSQLREWIESALGEYPSGFFQRIALKHIFIVEDLQVDGTPARGLAPCWDASSDATRIDAVDAPDNRVFLDETLGESDRFTVAHVLHHEIGHVVTFIASGRSGCPNWPSEGTGSSTCRIGTSDVSAGRQDGFISEYASANSIEDRAETFAFMMGNRPAAEILCGMDATVRRKVVIMANIMRLVDPTFSVPSVCGAPTPPK